MNMYYYAIAGMMQDQAKEADRKFLASLTPERLATELKLREIAAIEKHAEALRNQHMEIKVDHRHWGL